MNPRVKRLWIYRFAPRWKRIWVYLFAVVWISQLQAPGESRTKQIERWLFDIVRDLPARYYHNPMEIADRWTVGFIIRTAKEIRTVERETPLNVVDQFALYDLESEWRFWRCSPNTAKRYSHKRGRWYTVEVSRDCGLSQQNSVFVVGRWWKLYPGVKFRHWHQLQPHYSVQLALVRLKECREYWHSKKLTITCYNANSTARKEARFAERCRDLKALHKAKLLDRYQCEHTNYYKAWRGRVARFRAGRRVFKIE